MITKYYYRSQWIRKPTICIGETKGTDQLCSNCTADHRLCFGYKDNTISLLLKSEISSFLPASVTVQPGLCRTWSEPQIVSSPEPLGSQGELIGWP